VCIARRMRLVLGGRYACCEAEPLLYAHGEMESSSYMTRSCSVCPVVGPLPEDVKPNVGVQPRAGASTSASAAASASCKDDQVSGTICEGRFQQS
jgi:hypothetical protein